jgi:hypothetical protein
MLETITTPKERVAKSRTASSRRGFRRIEVTVPNADATLIRHLAMVLRHGGSVAETTKSYLQQSLNAGGMQTGADLVDFFSQSPLVGLDLSVEREETTGREVDLFGDR